MGNSDSHSPGSASDSPRHRSKTNKTKLLNVHASQVDSPAQQKLPDTSGTTVFYDTYGPDDDRYHTCKPDLAAGTHSKDIPAYYFTASQLHKSKNISKSQDAGLNRTSSDGQKVDVRHIEWPLNRKSETDSVSMIYYVALDNSMFVMIGYFQCM